MSQKLSLTDAIRAIHESDLPEAVQNGIVRHLITPPPDTMAGMRNTIKEYQAQCFQLNRACACILMFAGTQVIDPKIPEEFNRLYGHGKIPLIKISGDDAMCIELNWEDEGRQSDPPDNLVPEGKPEMGDPGPASAQAQGEAAKGEARCASRE